MKTTLALLIILAAFASGCQTLPKILATNIPNGTHASISIAATPGVYGSLTITGTNVVKTDTTLTATELHVHVLNASNQPIISFDDTGFAPPAATSLARPPISIELK
jgi:starvation-inducible outer membrane lipoprotein